MNILTGEEPRALICGDWYSAALITRELEARNWCTETAADLDEACEFLKGNEFDLLVAIWRLPAHNAFNVVHHVRTELGDNDIRVLVVSEGIGIETEMKLKIYGKVGFMHIPFCGLDFDCFKDWHHHQSLPQRRPVPI